MKILRGYRHNSDLISELLAKDQVCPTSSAQRFPSACSACALLDRSIVDMKTQGSRNGKALGISELLAGACSASAPLDKSWMAWRLQER